MWKWREKIRFRNNLISGFWPGSPSPGRDTRAGGCLTAIGIPSNKVCDSDQLCSIRLGVKLNRVSWGQNTSSLLRKKWHYYWHILNHLQIYSMHFAYCMRWRWLSCPDCHWWVGIDLLCCCCGKLPLQFYPSAFFHEMKVDLILSSKHQNCCDFSSVCTRHSYLENWMCSKNMHLVIRILIEKFQWKRNNTII